MADAPSRLRSIDTLRGLIMVVMALDHVGLMVGRFHSQDIFAQPFDVDRRALSGQPAIVVQNVLLNENTRKGEFSVSRTGVLAYISASLSETRLAWFDGSGKAVGAVDAQSHWAMAPDGVRVAADRSHSLNPDIQIAECTTGAARVPFNQCPQKT